MNCATATSETLAISAGAGLFFSFETSPIVPHAGVDGIGGRNGDAVHNFAHQITNQARLVFIDVNRSGVAAAFKFIPFIHNQEIAGA
jgi:hypothetical protein